MKHSINNKGKVVVLSATLINFMTGMMYAWSILSRTLVDEYNWTSKEASLPYTAFTVIFPIAMVFFGKFQDVKGPKITAILGSCFVGMGFILSGLMLNPLVLLITIGTITGIGVGMISISTTPPAIKWFHPSMKGKITGIVVAGVGMSAVLYSPLATYLLSKVSVEMTFIIMGTLVLLTSVLLSTKLQNPPEGFKFDLSKISKDYIESKDIPWRGMLRTSEFYRFWLMLGLSSSAGLMVISHIANISRVQIGWQAGFVLVMLVSLFNSFGRILGGSISDKMGRLELMRYLFIIQGINMILFRNATSVPLMVVTTAITGLCYGAGFSVFPATIGDYYGTKYFGHNYGILFTGWGLGGIIGPMTGAAIFDKVSNYQSAFLISTILLFIATLITFTFKKKV